MKWLFILLVLANLLFFGYTRMVEAPAPIDWKSHEVNASKVKIVAVEPAKSLDTPVVTGTLAPANAVGNAATADSATTPGTDTKPVAVADAPKDSIAEPKAEVKTEGKPELICVIWKGLLPDDVPNARKRLAALNLTGELKQDTAEAESPKRFWVYIPPRPSNEDAQKKAAELQALGVDDFFVVNDGSRWNHAISLGLFSTKEAADRRLEAIKQKGVRTALSQQRGEAATATAHMTVRHVPTTVFSALQAASKAFRGSVISKDGCY